MVIGLPTLEPAELRNPVASHLLLVVAASEETSRKIESYLRNSGHPMRAEWVSSVADIEQFLTAGAPDLVLLASAAPKLEFGSIAQLFRAYDPNLPVIGLLDAGFSFEAAVPLLRAGATDIVSHVSNDSLQHLAFVCKREITAYAQRRELRNLKAILTTFESRHQQLVSGTVDAVAQVQEGILAQANAAFAQLLGIADLSELVGVPLMDVIHPNSQGQIKALLKKIAKLGGKNHSEQVTCQLRGSQGEPVEVDIHLSAGMVNGEQSVEMLVKLEAPTDSPAPTVAAVATRASHLERIDALCASEDTSLTLAYAVIDHAAELEARLGFRGADQLADAVLDWLRSENGGRLLEVDRFGPAEYVMLLPADLENSRKQLDALRQAAAAHLMVTASNETNVSLSFAVVSVLPNVSAEKRLLTAAVAARKLSADGGNQVTLARDALFGEQGGDDNEAAAIELLRSALSGNRFKLAYQQIASLEGSTHRHVDVLVRIMDEEGREHQAGSFIGVAERNDMMAEIDRRVVVLALNSASRQKKIGGPTMMFLKLSEGTLKTAEKFLPWFHELLKGRRLPPGEVCFQVQELLLQNHIRKGKTLLKTLHEMGASIAIEHYGIGNQSIQLLEHIPVTFLKFDKSYTSNFDDRETQRKMANLMDIAKQRNIKTIVSHVENANIMARMWQMGVNFIQGYQIQEPEVVQLSSD